MSHAARQPRAGFTLVEMLVTVAALALIAVGVASIFHATGKTVSTGRRVSALTAYANLIETRMRADFEAMTRDGFLVIRNEVANLGNNSPLHPDLAADDPRQLRPRRTDEIVFFTRGRYASAREALASGFTARGTEARVYYGHGWRMPPNPAINSEYRYPTPTFDNRTQALLGGNVPGNPNRYATDWLLLRHQTVLAGPQITEQDQERIPLELRSLEWRDSRIQKGMQPAASSVFRRLAGLNVPQDAWSMYQGRGSLSGANLPVFASGLVDVAGTDLDEVRATLLAADSLPNQVGSWGEVEDWLFSGRFQRGSQARDRMQAWMDDALPANSMAASAADRTRIRAEPAPTDFFTALNDSMTNPVRGAYRRSDQLALSSSVFVPHCSEFIVEWTFGKMYPPNHDRAGEFIWHGMPRPDAGERRWEVADYRAGNNSELNVDDEFELPYRLRTGQLHSYEVSRQLIHGAGGVVIGPQADSLTSYFGYIDPEFTPTPPSLSDSLPWAWPKLVRVTMTLADPNDPGVERTFQFVFPTPGNPEP
jgi:prepilin-type N-terminal cleavage/methylation domain-containing protein